ncbi:hypothetical protein [Noviherbaspirillum malthae]|uniref:hypothetical protein n=1 Tax=Noviherbaspirillum malthae TaxID=1260987 RepID=UPI00188E32A7|nr:hypothetical protein [Noviherbaspirillum malthae]
MNKSAVTRELIQDVMNNFSLPHTSAHGPAHWARVRYNGLLLSQYSGADPVVVELFAFIHDSQRHNDGHDPQHGPRAAEYALRKNGVLFNLSAEQLDALVEACRGHTNERLNDCSTVQTCWDSDRLDLGRVGIMPDPYYLGTAAAKRHEILELAYARSIGKRSRVLRETVSREMVDLLRYLPDNDDNFQRDRLSD